MTTGPCSDVTGLVWSSLGLDADTYGGMCQWFNDDFIGNLLSQVGSLLVKWIGQFVAQWGWAFIPATWVITMIVSFVQTKIHRGKLTIVGCGKVGPALNNHCSWNGVSQTFIC
jgi:hypothetical protein